MRFESSPAPLQVFWDVTSCLYILFNYVNNQDLIASVANR
jgi:hypothetical protein